VDRNRVIRETLSTPFFSPDGGDDRRVEEIDVETEMERARRSFGKTNLPLPHAET